MAIQLSQQSPLMHSSAGSSDTGPLFWEIGDYYRSQFTQHWYFSLDEEFEEPLQFDSGTVFCVECVQQRPVCIGDDEDAPTSTYMILRTLDPRDLTGNSTLRFGIWLDGGSAVRSDYLKIEEPLVILALAGTGLAL